jgi:uncharacterized protein (DUF885 family)
MNDQTFNRLRVSKYFSLARNLLLVSALLFATSTVQAQTRELVTSYIDRWTDFYPSSAFGQGQKSAAMRFEDYTSERVSDWLKLNHNAEEILSSIADSMPLDERVDAQVLLRQVRLELERWEQDKVLSQQPQWYTGQISEALTYVLVSEKFSDAEKYIAVVNRMVGVRALCDLGIRNLKDGNPAKIEGALKSLQQTIEFYESKLLAQSDNWTEESNREVFRGELDQTTEKMLELAGYIRDTVLPVAAVPDKFGRDVYTRKLAMFSDNSLTPEGLSAIALEEIDRVRELMLELSATWWSEERAGMEPLKGQALLDAALAAMEDDRVGNRQDLLQMFREATKNSIEFVINHNIATVPANRTIIVELLPEHSPLARIGGVFPPGPFDPGAKTLLYLPSIPDDAPQEARDGFYRSFNNHFNKMIVSHEIFPGHDMQFKVGLEYASPVRALFHNPYHAEGWASFSEILMLDAGWSNGNQLTRLAHLRKRLENATRAYISVMVHAEGWNEEQVIAFATTRGLLPAQFAANLWNRSADLYMALQLTSYFVGFHGFERIWREEQQRLGDSFDSREFVDKVLKAGSVPMSALREIVK